MHPNSAFRLDDRGLHELLIEQIGFGMVFAATENGPRVAHTPLHSTGDGAVQFHLAKGNAVCHGLDGSNALIVINGPDGYVSPRWYDDKGDVPTWNYVALELEGRIRTMAPEGLADLLGAIAARQEARIAVGEPWRPDHVPPERWVRMFDAIIGFEMEVQAWRPTFKLSQNKPDAVREIVADELETQGSPGLAHLMRGIPT